MQSVYLHFRNDTLTTFRIWYVYDVYITLIQIGAVVW